MLCFNPYVHELACYLDKTKSVAAIWFVQKYWHSKLEPQSITLINLADYIHIF